MKLKWTTMILVLLVVAGCSSGNLNSEEVLTNSIEKMSEAENYSFKIHSEYIDGMENKTISEVQGKTIAKPFRTSINKQTEVFGQPIDTKAYFTEDRLYYEDFTAPNYLFKKELDVQQNHIIDGLKALQSKMEELEFSEQEDDYLYTYSVEEEKDKDFFQSLYPYFLHTDPLEKSINEMYLENSDVVDFHVVIKLDKETFYVKELQIDYVWNYDVADTGNPVPVSETIKMSYSDYNKLRDIPIPEEDFEKAVTFQEYLELSGSEEETPPEKSDHVPKVINENIGNSSANLMNGGRFATDGDWIYFSVSDKGLFKQKTDGTDKQQLLDHEVSHINVTKDWLFYIDKNQENKAFRMKKNGSERTQITDTYTENLMVVDEWVYYTPLVYSPNGEKGVHRMKTNLSDQEKILDHAFQFTVGQGYLFYQTDYPDYIHHINLNNLEEKPLMYTHLKAKHFAISDGWIYFEKADDEDRLYRRSLDTRDTYQVTEDRSQGFNVKGEHIFYRNIDDERSLYRYNVVTEEKVRLDDAKVHDMYIIDDYLYYGKTGANQELEWYRVPVNGKEIEKIEF